MSDTWRMVTGFWAGMANLDEVDFNATHRRAVYHVSDVFNTKNMAAPSGIAARSRDAELRHGCTQRLTAVPLLQPPIQLDDIAPAIALCVGVP
jgi:hypothetical protein